MPASKACVERTQIAARAAADKFGSELVALDLSDGDKPMRREGTDEWILLDYSDLVVHIQSTELRRYYMLDRLWNDCPKIELDIVREEAARG